MSRSAVFDCNVFLQAMLRTGGAAHACWERVRIGKAKLFVAPFVLAEVRSLPNHKSMRRFSRFTPDRVERFIEELLLVADLVPDPPVQFVYPRDPQDARYVDLAVSTGAMLVVSSDHDLLDLMHDSTAEARALRDKHPKFRVMLPAEFLGLVDDLRAF